jgi:hypothetical protein
MVSAFNDLAEIGGGLIKNVLGAIGIVVFAVGLFFLIRWIQKGTKKQKAFTIFAVIEDLNGVIDFDKIGLVKSDSSGLLEMQFQKRKQDSIPPIPKHLIKNGKVKLLNYAPGHYAVIDTYATMKNIEKGNFNIVLYNLGMKKYLLGKQRDILNKQENKKRKWETRAPWITLGIAILAAVLLAAFFMWIGAKIDSANIAQRVLECKEAGW